MGDGALGDLRVLEYGDMVLAPYTARLLADLGAKVIKVEPPAGDSSRRRGPFTGDAQDPERSGLFLYLNANKLGVTLDLARPEDRARFDDLIRWCDVFVHNLEPAQVAALDLTYEALCRLQPSLIMTSVTRFGMTGPYRDYKGYELTSMHGGGWGWLGPGHLEDPSLPPLKNFGLQGDFQTALTAAVATLAAVYATKFAGASGQHLDVSAFEALADNKYNSGIQAYLVTGLVPDRFGKPLFGPSGVVQCSDGHLFLLCVEEHQWQSLLDIIGRPEWTTWEVFREPLQRGDNNDVLMPLVAAQTKEMPKAELYALLQRSRIPTAPLFDMADLLSYEHLQARDYWATIEHPRAGTLTFPGAPYKFSETPWALRRPAPLLGEHNELVFSELCSRGTVRRTEAPVQATAAAADTGTGRTGWAHARKLLEGIRVLDLTTAWAGPAATQELRRLGADVIRVETTTRRVASGVRPHGVVVSGYSSPGGHNQGKRSILLNLRSPEGADVARKIAAECDIVIENFSAGAMARAGLSYEHLRQLNERLIMVSASGYGQTGPHKDYVSYGRPQSYLSGLVSLTGYPGGGPRELGIPYGDPNAGQFIVLASLAALHHRERTGQGQFVDLSQLEAFVTNSIEGLLEYTLRGTQPERRGNRDSRMCPHSIYRCAGDDTWVSIVCGDEAEWRAFVAAIGQPKLAADPRFATAALRKTHEDELDALITRWTGTRDRYAITEELQRAGVAAFPVMNGRDLTGDPHLAARDVILDGSGPDGQPRRVMGLPWRLTGGIAPLLQATPAPGEHTREVIAELLGLTEEQIDELEACGALR